jgi:UDP-N-acetylmuramyl pentapeptide phosphotransferase/UDP-N-acetylglucosamine-1-phosphate transferase
LGIALISGLLAFSGGLGSVAVGEYMDRSIRGKRGIMSALGMPPIAAIPFIDNLQDSPKTGKRKLVFVFVFIGLLIIVLSAVHVFVKPLDEFQKDIFQKEKISQSVNGTGKSIKKGEAVENKLQ